ncbi:MAG: A/G-specific adenine glycosylase [Deltaproteobacteria bacterium]|nr:A/G-specific adenine glycosylase [Deltaproteobacteria bacterium]
MRRELLQWFQDFQRPLPWRKNQNPYSIWVSEIMLQQTQVATVIPYFERFMKRFPSLQDLAKASEEEVLSFWSGLGYYRRARFLHRGAQEVQNKYQGKIPNNFKDLKNIPGIGDYTAGAIASIAFQQASPVVDGNVIRVLSRFYALQGHAKEGTLIKKIWEKAQALVQGPQPGDFNQALMELGATLCRVKAPDCGHCPIAQNCQAYQKAKPEDYPQSPPKPKVLRLHRLVALCQPQDKTQEILLVKKKKPKWFQGLWELPHEYIQAKDEVQEVLQQSLKKNFNLDLLNLRASGSSRHGITHHRIESHGYLLEVGGELKIDPLYAEAKFVPIATLNQQALPNFERKILKQAQLLDK